MKYLVIADIHSNIEAFEAVLEKASGIGYDKLVFLGDVVGYGANPEECILMLKSRMDFGVAGNHDRAIIDDSELSFFNEIAREAILWTREKLSGTPHIKFLTQLPYIKEIEPGIVITHSSVSAPEYWDYILSPYEAQIEFESANFKIMLYGHTHVPGGFEYIGGEAVPITDFTIHLDESRRYILNPGSVGQPRDGDNRASFAILDTERRIFQIYRVHYRFEDQQRKIKEAGLPLQLATRLEMGR